VRPPFVPAAVVFDLDGLLVDSEDAWAQAEQRVVAAYGAPWDPKLRTLLLGRGAEEAARLLADHLGVADHRAVGRRVLQEAAAGFRTGIGARRGARELVEALAVRLPLAVATNARRVLADLALSSSGLGAAMTAVVCAEDVPRAKPAPDPYLAACTALRVEPGACVGLEDSPVGVAAAKAAGLWVIGCPSVDGLVLSGADAVVDSLADVDAAAWV
jgi:HAD superfamily hydrolase (TIGR01509 family)